MYIYTGQFLHDSLSGGVAVDSSIAKLKPPPKLPVIQGLYRPALDKLLKPGQVYTVLAGAPSMCGEGT